MALSTSSLVHTTEQTAALVRLYSDAGLTNWHAAVLADKRKHLAQYMGELLVLIEDEMETRSEAYRLGVEVDHYLATR